MTKFLLQTYAIAGVRAELEKWEEEWDFYSKQLENTDIGEYNKKHCTEKRDEAIKNSLECRRIIKEIENYEF